MLMEEWREFFLPQKKGGMIPFPRVGEWKFLPPALGGIKLQDFLVRLVKDQELAVCD